MFSAVSYLIERKIQSLERSPRCWELVDLVQRETIEDDNRQKAPVCVNVFEPGEWIEPISSFCQSRENRVHGAIDDAIAPTYFATSTLLTTS